MELDTIHHQLLLAFSRSNHAMTSRIRTFGLMPGQPKVLEFVTENEGCLRDLIIGSVQNGIDSGLDFSGMVKADGAEAAVEEIQDDAKYSLVAVTGAVRMTVEGKVRYMSAGVTLADENTVVTSEDSIVFRDMLCVHGEVPPQRYWVPR